jgi:predicted O-methyltransferase YrrM
MDFDSTWAQAADIAGWLSREQAMALYDAAGLVEAGNWIVEIGSHRGRSTVVLGAGKRPGVGLAAVDPFDNPRWGGGPESYEIFSHNLEAAGLTGQVEAIRTLSAEAASAWPPDRAVQLLFVDGAHDVTAVLTDIDMWRPHLAAGARIYLHDAFSSIGVTEALFRRLVPDRSVRYLGSVRSLSMFATGDNLTVTGFLQNRARVARQMAYFGRNLVVKVAIKRNRPGVARALGWTEGGYPF